MKRLMIMIFAIGLFINPIKADESDPFTGAVLLGSAAVFGTMVGTTGLLSHDSLSRDARSRDNDRGFNMDRPTIQDAFDAVSDGNLDTSTLNFRN